MFVVWCVGCNLYLKFVVEPKREDHNKTDPPPLHEKNIRGIYFWNFPIIFSGLIGWAASIKLN